MRRRTRNIDISSFKHSHNTTNKKFKAKNFIYKNAKAIQEMNSTMVSNHFNS